MEHWAVSDSDCSEDEQQPCIKGVSEKNHHVLYFANNWLLKLKIWLVMTLTLLHNV